MCICNAGAPMSNFNGSITYAVRVKCYTRLKLTNKRSATSTRYSVALIPLAEPKGSPREKSPGARALVGSPAFSVSV